MEPELDRLVLAADRDPLLAIAAALVVIFGLIFVIFGWRRIGARRRKRRLMEEEESLGVLHVDHGTPVSQIPTYEARLEFLATRPHPSAPRVVDELLMMGLSLNASDIHLTPGAEGARVAFRVHGLLYDAGVLPPALYERVATRVKVKASLPLFKKATPLDGQIDLEGGRYKVRVSLLPTNHGEKTVLRLASADYGTYRLDGLGMDDETQERLEAILNANQGLIVVTGPTGSGKTTTMYACLQNIQTTRGESANICTLEDPIEFDFPGFSQTQISRGTGMTFAVALRSLLRQDPDVILVGEIRDDETAAIAIRAAMTGHLIFTTVHADSAAGIFNRVTQMEVEGYNVASAVRAVIAQRLCQKLCPDCAREAPLTDRQRRQFALLGHEDPPEGPFYVADGCEMCLGKGLIGRLPIYEVLFVTDAVRDLISEGKPTHQIARQARAEGMRSLFEHGLERARAGEVPLDEVLRVLSQ